MKILKVPGFLALCALLGSGCSVIVKNKLEKQEQAPDIGVRTDQGQNLADLPLAEVRVEGEVPGREHFVIGERLRVFPGEAILADTESIELHHAGSGRSVDCPGERREDHFECVIPSLAPNGEVTLRGWGQGDTPLNSLPIRIERQLLIGQGFGAVAHLHSADDLRLLQTLELALPMSAMPQVSPSGRYMLLRVADYGQDEDAFTELILLDLVLLQSIRLGVFEIPFNPDIPPHSFEPVPLSPDASFTFIPEETLWIVNQKGAVLKLQLPRTIEAGEAQWLASGTDQAVPIRQLHWAVSPRGQKRLMGLSEKSSDPSDSGVRYFDGQAFQGVAGPSDWTPLQITSLIPADPDQKQLRDEVVFMVLLQSSFAEEYAINAYLHLGSGTEELLIPPAVIKNNAAGEPTRVRAINQILGTNLLGLDIEQNPGFKYSYGIMVADKEKYKWNLKETAYTHLRNERTVGLPAAVNTWRTLVHTQGRYFVHEHQQVLPALMLQKESSLQGVVHHPLSQQVFALASGELIRVDYSALIPETSRQPLTTTIDQGGLLIQP